MGPYVWGAGRLTTHNGGFRRGQVYEFSTSGELGITASGSLIVDGAFQGVYAIDFALTQISTALDRILGQSPGAWAFAVERSGPNRGLLLGATGNPVLYDGTTKVRGVQNVLLHGLPLSL